MSRLREGASPDKPAICPECGSADIVIGDQHCVCNSCGEVFRTDDETRRRVAATIVLPVVRIEHWSDPAWCEQHDRERWAQAHNDAAAPPRTRPLVVAYRPEQER